VDVFADGTYTYTPSAEFTGTESFDFRVTDANGVFSVSTVSVDAGSGEGTLVCATLSATEGNVALTEGDMQAALSGSSDYVYGTQMMDGGKWYFEWDVISNANGPEVGFSRAGNTGPGSTTGDRILLSTTAGAIPGRNGVADTFGGTTTWNNKGGTAAGANTGRYMAAIDIDTGKVWFGIPNANGTGQDLWFPSSSLGSNDTTTGTAAGWTTFDETAPTYTNANAIPNQEWFIYATSSVPGEAIKIYTDRSDWLGSAPTTEFEAVATVEGGGVVFNPTAGGDYLEGSADANVIDGQAGDDKLIGNGGADTLTGGAGDDTYSFGRGDGADLIDNIGEGASADKVKFGATIDTDQLWFRQVGNDLVVDVIGTTDSVTVDEWFASADNRVDTLETADGSTLDDGNVQNLVSAMAEFSPPLFGETELADAFQGDDLNTITSAIYRNGVAIRWMIIGPFGVGRPVARTSISKRLRHQTRRQGG